MGCQSYNRWSILRSNGKEKEKWITGGEWSDPNTDNNLKSNFFNTQQVAKDCENNIGHLGHLGYWGFLELKGDEGNVDLDEESSLQIADRNFQKVVLGFSMNATFKVWLDTSRRCFSFKLSYKPL